MMRKFLVATGLMVGLCVGATAYAQQPPARTEQTHAQSSIAADEVVKRAAKANEPGRKSQPDRVRTCGLSHCTQVPRER
jgi:hypothetical protein